MTSLKIDDGASVVMPNGGFATSANFGSALDELGVQSKVGNIWSVGSVKIDDRAQVTGFIKTGGTVTRGNSTTVTGTITQHATITPDTISRTVVFPASGGSDQILPPGAPQLSLTPGRYGQVTVNSGATLLLSSGTYYFDSFDIEPTSFVKLDKTKGWPGI